MKSLITTTPVLLCAGLLATGTGAAQQPSPLQEKSPAKGSAYRSSVSQEQLRGDTRRVKEELLALIDEYAEYTVAGAEIAKLRDAAGELSQLDETQMRQVVEALRDASRLEDPAAVSAKAAGAVEEQKKIQVRLRELADRLAQQKALTEMRMRLQELQLRQAANLRETRQLDPVSSPQEQQAQRQAEARVAAAEQKAIQEEIRLAQDRLEKLSKEDAPASEPYRKALEQLDQSRAADRAAEAAAKIDHSPAQAAEDQKAVADSLKEAVAALDAARSEQERVASAAEKLQELAKREEQLAKTPQNSQREKDAAAKEQGAIADELDLARQGMEELHPSAGQEMNQEQQKAEELSASQQSSSSDSQKSAQQELAKNLEATGNSLREKAEQLAKEAASGSSQQGEGQQAGQDQQQQQQQMQQQMDALAGELGQAKDALEAAAGQQNQDAAKAGEQAAQAGEKLDKAAQMASQAAGNLPPEIAAEIGKAGQKTDEGQQALKQGNTPGDQLSQAKGHVEQALKSLQQAQAQMAAQMAQQSGKPKSNSGRGQVRQAGDESSTETADTVMTPQERREAGRREALQLLQQEKAAPQYDEMIQQYIRNLADGETPGK